MNKRNVIFLCFLLFFIFGNRFFMASQAHAQPAWNMDQRVSNFYAQLQPYGEWVWHGTYGWVWRPYNVAVDWRPYTLGRWIYTEHGWTWMSDEPWGWACYHYGRWFYDNEYGWLWYPDTTWAPSWVAWRSGGDWIGWAPLPPQAGWSFEGGLVFSNLDEDNLIPWFGFSFSHIRDFDDRDLRNRIERHSRNVLLLKDTAPSANTVRVESGRVVSHLPFEDRIKSAVGHPIAPLKLVDVATPAQHGISGNEVRMFRPEHAKTAVAPATTVSVGAQPAVQVPPDLQIRHASEIQSLQDMQAAREKAVRDEHARELQNARDEAARSKIQQQHQTEINALQEQASRERQMVESWHNREVKMSVAAQPAVQPSRPFIIPSSTPVSSEQGRGSGEDKSAGKGHR